MNKGVAVVHYNRFDHIKSIVEAVLDTTTNCKVVVCDDGSNQGNILDFVPKEVVVVRGPNLGVAANKNRALWALQDCSFLAILEDDLIPKEKGWFEIYETASTLSGIHHFCRVQEKEVPETIPQFSGFFNKNSFTPIYGPSPRGDLTFITNKVLRVVGSFNPLFKGAGYAHGEWSSRVAKAGLIGHPLKWIDIKEARDKFEQIGDTSGGRWDDPKVKINGQLKKNRTTLKQLESSNYIYHPVVLQ